MNYKEQLIKKIENSDQWPSFQNTGLLEDLNTLSDKSFNQKTLTGSLASVLIYSQLLEELVKCLVNCSHFLIQCSVFPQEINKKDKQRQTLGSRLDELEQGIVDENIKKFIEECRIFNDLRNSFVHKLTLKNSLASIESEIQLLKELFDSSYKLFDKIYDKYNASFSDYKKNIYDLKDFLED